MIALGGEQRFWTWNWLIESTAEQHLTDAESGSPHFAFDYSPDGELIALTTNNRLQVWDAATMEPVFKSGDVDRALSGLAWLPDSQTIVTLARDGRIILFERVDLEAYVAETLDGDPKCFSGEDRASMKLAATPPAWCASGQ